MVCFFPWQFCRYLPIDVTDYAGNFDCEDNVVDLDTVEDENGECKTEETQCTRAYR